MSEGVLDRWTRELNELPAGTVARRAGLIALFTVGLLATAYASYIFALIPWIPLPYFPDARLLALLLSGIGMGIYMAGGGAKRRAAALWGAIGYVTLFHLEEATIHWIAPVPGSITGTRVGLIGTAGSLLMVLAVILMHVEVESGRMRANVVKRGADPARAGPMMDALAAEGRRRAFGYTAFAAALGLFIFVAEKVFGDTATGGSYILLVGGGLLVVLALYLLKSVPSTKRA